MDLENQYYSSKALKETDPKGALESFQRVLELEEEKGDWGFKALKQMIKINFRLVGVRLPVCPNACSYPASRVVSSDRVTTRR